MSAKQNQQTILDNNATALKVATELRLAVNEILKSDATDCLKEKAIKAICGSISVSAHIPVTEWLGR